MIIHRDKYTGNYYASFYLFSNSAIPVLDPPGLYCTVAVLSPSHSSKRKVTVALGSSKHNTQGHWGPEFPPAV